MMNRLTRNCAILLLLWIAGSIVGFAQNFNLTVAVLVNSSNTAGFNPDPTNPGKYQRYAERYFENFQIPYELFDVSTAVPPADLSNRQLIIAGHPGLSLPAAWQTAIVSAVNGGSGFVNFDSDPAIGTASHMQAIFGATGSVQGTASSSITVPLAVTSGGATPHYIAGLQMKTVEPAGDFVYNFHVDQNGTLNTATATVLQNAQGTVIAQLGTDPLIVATAFGAGRGVNFGTLDYLQADRFGFLMGVDDLFWRSLVWAARKPFVMRSYPRFWSLRMDYNVDSNWISRIRTMYDPALTGTVAADGTGGPWKVTDSVNLDFLPPGDQGRAQAISDMRAGKLQVSPHAFNKSGFGDLFWEGSSIPGRGLTDAEWQNNIAALQRFQQGNGGSDTIPFFSQWWVGHFYNLSNNIGFDLANTFGARYVGTTIKPGFPYAMSPAETAYQEERLHARPYWIYQLPPKPMTVLPSDESYSFFFADDITIGSRSGLPDQKLFLASSRALDLGIAQSPALSWCNSQGDGVGFSSARFEWYSWRLFSSLVPAEVYNQDDAFQQCTLSPPPPSTSFHNGAEQIIHNVSTWLNGHGARHVFMQDMAQYIFARSKSTLTRASFDGTNISYTLTGNAVDPDGNRVATEILIFDGDTEGRRQTIPGFKNGLTITVTNPPTVVATSLAPASSLFPFTLRFLGDAEQLNFVVTFSDSSTQDLTTAVGTTYSSSTPAVATVSPTGRVTAVANGASTITASNGNISATVTVSVNIPPPPDFSLPSALGSASVNAGQSATYSMTIASISGFRQPITFTCSGAPAAASCAVSPNSVTPGGASTMAQIVVTTTARASAFLAPQIPPAQPLGLIILIGSLALLFGSMLKGMRRLAVALPALLLVIASVGCGGGGSSNPITSGGSSGTPAGTYSLTITGTSGAQSHSTTATLVVK